jgi:hypothetical protein
MSLSSALKGWRINAMGSKGTKDQNRPLTKAPIEKLRQSVSGRMIAAAAPEVYEIRPRKDGHGFDLINDRLRYGPIWYSGPDAVARAVAYAKFRSWSRSRKAMIRVLDHSDILIEAH